jgi:hypothetical protein
MPSDGESSLLAPSAKRKSVQGEAVVTEIRGQQCELVQECALPGQCLCSHSSVYKKNPWFESASELYRPSDRRLFAK